MKPLKPYLDRLEPRAAPSGTPGPENPFYFPPKPPPPIVYTPPADPPVVPEKPFDIPLPTPEDALPLPK